MRKLLLILGALVICATAQAQSAHAQTAQQVRTMMYYNCMTLQRGNPNAQPLCACYVRAVLSQLTAEDSVYLARGITTPHAQQVGDWALQACLR